MDLGIKESPFFSSVYDNIRLINRAGVERPNTNMFSSESPYFTYISAAAEIENPAFGKSS